MSTHPALNLSQPPEPANLAVDEPQACAAVPAAPRKATRRSSNYDRPTPAKVAMGARLLEAREQAGLEQEEAAQRLGYSCGVHLCEFERGKKFMPHDRLVLAAPLYGVSMDYLYGLQDDPTPDPVHAMQEAIAGRIAAEVHHLARTMVLETGTLVRSYLPSGAQAQRLASLVLEAHEALVRLRARCPEFDRDMPASALVSRLDLAAEVATTYVEGVRRARDAQVVRDRHAALRALTSPLTLPALTGAG